MKSVFLATLLEISFSASASDLIGQISYLCSNTQHAEFAVNVYKNITDVSDQEFYVTTPLGFLGRSNLKSSGNHVIVDLPVPFGAAGDEVLDIDLSTNRCHPSAILKTKTGAQTSLVCSNNDGGC